MCSERSDEFDISPQIRSLPDDRQKVVFLVDHRSDTPAKSEYKGAIEDIRKQEGKKKPFQRFSADRRVLRDTDELIRALWKELVCDDYIATEPTRSQSWQRAVDEWLSEAQARTPHGLEQMISGRLFMKTSQFSAAFTCFREALKLARDHGKEKQKCTCLSVIGILHQFFDKL